MIVNKTDVGNYKVSWRHDKRTREAESVIEELLAGKCENPGKEKRRDSRSKETDLNFSAKNQLISTTPKFQQENNQNCKENLQNPSYVRHLRDFPDGLHRSSKIRRGTGNHIHL